MTSSPGSTSEWMIAKIITFAPGLIRTQDGSTDAPCRSDSRRAIGFTQFADTVDRRIVSLPFFSHSMPARTIGAGVSKSGSPISR